VRNWKGKCRLVQLFHNHGVDATAAMVRQHLGWQVTEEVREQWRKIDRDKAKHREIKADPSYNRRQREIALGASCAEGGGEGGCRGGGERREEDGEGEDKGREGQGEKTRKVVTVKHTYSVRKLPLYGDVETGKEEKRGRGRKRKAEEAIATGSASKENAAPAVNRIADDATTPHSTSRSSQPLHPCFAVMP